MSIDAVEPTPTTETPQTTETTTPASLVPEAPAPVAATTPAQVATETPKPGEVTDAPVSEQYETFNLPEGWVIADSDLNAFQQIAESLEVRTDGKGLTQAGAQQLVDMFIGIEQNRNEMLTDMQAGQERDRDAQWQEELQSDPDVGGEKFEAAQANIVALEASGVLVPEFSAMLVETGQFKNPAVIKQLANLGKMIQENPTVIGGGPGGGDGLTPAQRMFANSGHV